MSNSNAKSHLTVGEADSLQVSSPNQSSSKSGLLKISHATNSERRATVQGDHRVAKVEFHNERLSLLFQLRLLVDSQGPPDLILSNKDYTFEVHEAILCAQSQFFSLKRGERMLKRTASGTSPKVPLADTTPTIQRLLSYMYSGGYGDVDLATSSPFFVRKPSPATQAKQRHNALLLHATMYNCGETYGVASLKEVAKLRFKELADGYWPYRNLYAIIVKVYDAVPKQDRGLKDIVRDICLDHLDELLAGPLWVSILRSSSTASLASELLPKIIERKDKRIAELEERLRESEMDRPSKKQKRDETGKDIVLGKLCIDPFV